MYSMTLIEKKICQLTRSNKLGNGKSSSRATQWKLFIARNKAPIITAPIVTAACLLVQMADKKDFLFTL